MNELISVIIPVYNRANIIRRTIDSVLSQTYTNIEILVIDDFSIDYDILKQIITEYRDSRIKLLRNDKNINGAASRNKGILHSKGEFIAFLDSDDEWHSTKLELQLKYAKENNFNGVIYTKSLVVNRAFVAIRPDKAITDKENISEYLFVNDGYIPTPSIFLPKPLAEKCLFNPDLRRHQDYDLLLRLHSMNVRFHMIDKVLVKVNYDPNGKSEKRGASYELSEYFLHKYSQYFTVKSKKYFWMKNVGFYMARAGRKYMAISQLCTKKIFIVVPIMEFITYLVYYIFYNTIFYKALERLFVHFKQNNKNINVNDMKQFLPFEGSGS
jgi:glycosyltransferase involved in cell wall biosynthesis